MKEGKKKKEPVVYALAKPSRCYGCDRKLLVNEIVRLDRETEDCQVFCLECAGLSKLVALEGGNAILTRLAKKYSTVCYVIVKWSDLWKCYERKGLLVEEAALQQAKKEAILR